LSSTLPVSFVERIQQQLPVEGTALLAALDESPSLAIRFNQMKSTEVVETSPVPWCNEGYYLNERPDFTADPLLHAGAYYVQEASSMFIQYALKQVMDVTQPLVAFDLCAAPGGKSTLLLDTLSPESLLVSNEVIRARANILRENIAKWGRPNAIVTNSDPKAFQSLTNFFDVVLVDAPCSGEGMFRKDKKARDEWSPEHVNLCAARQQRILADVADTVKAGGVLLYSTCTFNEEEDEQQVKHLLSTGVWESVQLNIPAEWNITETHSEAVVGYHFYPHKTRGEGFFVSVLRRISNTHETPEQERKAPAPALLPVKEQYKLNGWINEVSDFDYMLLKDLLAAFPKAWTATYQLLKQHVQVVQCGVTVGKLMREEVIPAHELALSSILNTSVNKAELSREQAITYLKKGNLLPEAEWPKGWVLMCYKQHPLGWAKVLDRRLNNYYPTEWRILKDIEF
jgi:16S rRNA C967 or C1407 C5-methylase (RsmB/RsmF family)/NOL1/NOP2/fmu family ribosome biogenesis protein